MPKQLKELKNFMKGITSNASPTDIHDESASYSLNINSNNILGRLEGIKQDTILSENGFKTIEELQSESQADNPASIIIDFENIIGVYGGGETQATTDIDDFNIQKTHRLLEMYAADEQSSVTSIDNMERYSMEPLSGDEYPAYDQPRPFFFFDDNGTLQYIPIIRNSANPAMMKWHDLGAFLPKRLTGADVNGSAFSSRPMYGVGFFPEDGGGQNPSEPRPTFLHPLLNMVQIHLDGEEWLFKITDTDASAPYPVPLTAELSGWQGNVMPPDSLTGNTFFGNNWNVNVVNYDVDLNWNRTKTIAGATINYVKAFLVNIIATLNASDKVESVTLDNQTITIIPKNTDAYNTARVSHFSTSADWLDNWEAKITTTSFAPITFNGVSFKSMPDKFDRSKTDIVSIAESGNGASAFLYSNIFSQQPTKTQLNSGTITFTDLDLQVDSDKIYIGTGGNADTPPKVALKTESNDFINSIEGMKLEDFNLASYEESGITTDSIVAGETVIFPIHGREVATDEANHVISWGPQLDLGHDPYSDESWADDNKTSNLDYDFETVGTTSDAALHTFISTNNVQIGQIIRIHADSEDSDDGAFQAWKRYDYDVTATVLQNDLFMYCGEAEHATPYPVLRYVGKQADGLGGEPSFSYTYQKYSTKIGKVSLTATSDGEAFTGGSAGSIQPSDGTSDVVAISNVGNRVAYIDILDLIASEYNTYITSLSPCQSPLLYNTFGLPGGESGTESVSSQITPFNYQTSDIFRVNGNLKWVSRHGVFYLGLKGQVNKIYRLNLIDFHDITDNGVGHDELNFNFSNIPNRLRNNHTEQDWGDSPDGHGIININIADQEYGPNRSEESDAEMHPELGTMYLAEDGDSPENFMWSNIPVDAQIVGICETFECGRITKVNTSPDIQGDFVGEAVEFTALPCDTSIESEWSGRRYPDSYGAGENHGDSTNEADTTSPKWVTRLTTGDKVMFVGLDAGSADNPTLNETHTKFNVHSPHEVNMVDVNKFIVQTTSEGGIPKNGTYHEENAEVVDSNNKSFWWNSKIWILYAKETEGQGFNKWDLFLYNANTLDIDNQKQLNMADRTLPYSEVGYYNHPTAGDMYYPRQFAFMMNHTFSNAHSSVNPSSLVDYDSIYGSHLKRSNFMPNGYSISSSVESGISGKPYAASWGIYDKGGRWTTDGGMQWLSDNYQSAGQFYSVSYPGRSTDRYGNDDTDERHFLQHGAMANGKLFWGHNLGWDCRTGRKIEPLSNSLHPLSHYSRSFLAGRIYHGSSYDDKETFNLPRHAVSFLGNLTGDFVGKPPTLERDENDLSVLRTFLPTNQDSQSNVPESTTEGDISNYTDFNENVNYTVGSTGWIDELGDTVHYNTVYSNDLTLFQLDEWTGHPGIVYRNTYEGDTPSQTDFGVVRGRPNFGGPEIENPKYKPWVMVSGNGEMEDEEEYKYNTIPGADSTRHVLTNQSNNRGFYNGNQDLNKGWGGYKPPSLFEPGQGYYVFINRTWKTASNRTLLNNKYSQNMWAGNQEFNWSEYVPGEWVNDTWVDPYYNYHEIQVSPTTWEPNVWKFQWYDWPDDSLFKDRMEESGLNTNLGYGDRLDKSANRWNNFSCTAVADATFPIYAFSASTRGGFDTSPAGFHNKNAYNKQTFKQADFVQQGDAHQNQVWACNKYVARSFAYEQDDDNIYTDIPKKITENNNVQYGLSVKHDSELNAHKREHMDSVFKWGRGQVMGPVCTMHKIDVEGFDKINNIFPTILRSAASTVARNHIEYNNNVNGTFDEAQSNIATYNQYTPVYLCGVKKENDTSAILVINQDMTTFMAKDSKRSSYSALFWDYNNQFKKASLYTTLKRANCNGVNWEFDSNARYTCYHNRDTSLLETIQITDSISKIKDGSSQNSNLLRFRGAAFKEYNSDIFSDNLTIWDSSNMTPVTQTTVTTNGSVSSTATDNVNIWFSTLNFNRSKNLFGYNQNIFDLEKGGQNIYIAGAQITDDNGDIVVAGAAETGGYFKDIFLHSENDGAIISTSLTSIEFTQGNPTEGGPIEVGLYKYKFTFEYDGEFESELQQFGPYTEEVDDVLDFLELTIKLTPSYLQTINKRITGIGVYRTIGEDSAYGLVDIIKLKADEWTYDVHQNVFYHTIKDTGTSISYEDWNGISQDLEHTSSMHYGLSAIYKGYMFISNAWHPELNDTQRYVFRSSPGNFFRYDWTSDFCIMPEVPIAMTSFNSRLYIWGQNKLYKLDPITLLIEDEYEGISITGKNAFVKTEFGLCFLDKNNVYLHDGNKPNPIGNPILNSAAFPKDTSGNKIQAGYKELIKQTLINGDLPTVFFLNSKNSFAITLSNSEGKGRLFLYNILNQRWDLSESPRPRYVNSSSDGTVLLSDGNLLYNITSAEDEEFTNFARREWTWHSGDLTFGADTQDKVFKSMNLTGTPSYFNIDDGSQFSSTASVSNSVRMYINDSQVPLNIENKHYASTILGGTYLSQNLPADTDEFEIKSENPVNTKQEFIRPGHYIKINDEIMWVSAINTFEDVTKITVLRAQLSTTNVIHSVNAPISLIAPRLKITSNKKGKKLKIILEKQRGYIDSIGVVFKPKSIK